MANNIHPTAIIYPGVTLGDNIFIGPYCIIGAPPESRAFDGQPGYGVIIGNDVQIHGHVTIDAGTLHATIVGNGCYIMKQVHLGHDVYLVKDVTIAPGAVVCGHVTVGEGCTIGVNATIRNRVTVPAYVRIGMLTSVTATTKLESFNVYAGCPAKWLKPWNPIPKPEAFHCVALQEEQPRCDKQCDACSKTTPNP